MVEWTANGLASEFVQINQTFPERRFCFVLGAGASQQSGIPTGAELVDTWLHEIRFREEQPTAASMSSWATATRLGIPGFRYEQRASHYPALYRRRFRHDRETGYAYLEDLMEGKEPSFGYVVLSRILADGRHNAVVTTNFDDLVARALSVFTRITPRSIGHERLAQFVTPSSRRPIIAKVHRDLLLQPQNEPDETASLPDDWKLALDRIFSKYTPIVVGYGGNDGSLMSFLEDFGRTKGFRGTLIWCQRHEDCVEARVEQFIESNSAIVARIPGFDELMLLLGEKLGVWEFESELTSATEAAVARLNDQIKRLRISLAEETGPDSQSARDALTVIVNRELESLRTETGKDKNPDDLVRLGKRLLDNEHWSEASEVFEELLKINEALRQTEAKAKTLMNLGRAYQGDGHVRKAERLFHESLRILRELRNLEGQAIVLGNLGVLLEDAKRDQEAAEAYDEAFRLDLQMNRRPGAVFNGGRLGLLRRRMGALEEAVEPLRTAARIAAEEGNYFYAQLFKGNLGSVYRDLGDYEDAKATYGEALEIAKRIGALRGTAITLDNLGQVYAATGELQRAAELFAESSWIDSTEGKNPTGEGKSRGNLALILRFLGREEEARQQFDRAVQLLQKFPAGSVSLEKLRKSWVAAERYETAPSHTLFL